MVPTMAHEGSELLPAVADVVTNTWAVRVHPEVDAEWLASLHGLKFRGPTGLSEEGPGEVFLFELVDAALNETAGIIKLASSLLADQLAEAAEKLEKALEGSPYVMWAQRQVAKTRSKRALTLPVTDPLFGSQWHLSGSHSVNAVGVWSIATGKGVTVAVVDDGLLKNHPDIAPKFVAQGSYDFNGQDSDPSPARLDVHGTEVGGTVGAAENNYCGIGVAPDVGLSGVRLLGGAATDVQEAQALSYKRDINHIYSNSWGPIDDGKRFEGPGPLTYNQLISHAGRNGLGSVYVWAGGNGRAHGDNCNYDGYANLPETIAVGAITHDGTVSYYSESCAALITCAPSSGDAQRKFGIVTDSSSSSTACSSTFGGTSAAAPIVSGVVAMMLEANPNLGWRDVQGLLVHNGVRVASTDGSWSQNGADLWFSHDYGFGLIDASLVVPAALSWTNYPPQQRVTTSVQLRNSAAAHTFTWAVNERIIIEHTVVHLFFTTSRVGNFRLLLTSPSGMVSRLQEYHSDTSSKTLDWDYTSVAHWDEVTRGTWTISIETQSPSYPVTVNSLAITFFGHNN
ncbi:MAG: S8 family serine peptidase [archaeon]|nr:S8 family serine peptidase [archaeon]